jgi:hypothetical protein
MENRKLLEEWISYLESREPRIDSLVAEAAYAVLPAAVWYSEGSPGEAAEVLAKTAFEVSKFVLRNGPPARDKDGQAIRDMKDYLYRGYMKKANHRFRQEPKMDAALVRLDPTRDMSDGGSSRWMMENDALFRELYSQMEPKLKVMFYWREIKGCRWRQVGKIVGMKAHAARFTIIEVLSGSPGWSMKEVMSYRSARHGTEARQPTSLNVCSQRPIAKHLFYQRGI